MEMFFYKDSVLPGTVLPCKYSAGGWKAQAAKPIPAKKNTLAIFKSEKELNQ